MHAHIHIHIYTFYFGMAFADYGAATSKQKPTTKNRCMCEEVIDEVL